jgi:regulator of cell morphogenesis and NO signaling
MSGMNGAIGPAMTLGDIVTRHPSLARELEHLGLDFCCCGDATLGQACRDVGLDASAVAAQLSSSIGDDSPADWLGLDIAGLVAHVVDTHHRYLWDELPRLDELVAEVVGAHGERHVELTEIARCFREMRAAVESHLLEEERMLFPAVLRMASTSIAPTFAFGSIGSPISTLLCEHDDIAALLRELRSLSNDYRVPDDGCPSYRALFEGLEQLEADTHLHVHKENNVLFPRIVLFEDRCRC